MHNKVFFIDKILKLIFVLMKQTNVRDRNDLTKKICKLEE